MARRSLVERNPGSGAEQSLRAMVETIAYISTIQTDNDGDA